MGKEKTMRQKKHPQEMVVPETTSVERPDEPAQRRLRLLIEALEERVAPNEVRGTPIWGD
jgi:hypothetical protein